MKKIFRRFKVIKIEVLIYRMENYVTYDKEFHFSIEKKRMKNKWCYFVKDGATLIHQSFLFDKVYLLKSFNKRGPVIGDCFTNKKYRGRSIYPIVLNAIAKDVLEQHKKDVFVIVNRANISSIKGIEKAGFVIFASLDGMRWLWFYLKRSIKYYERSHDVTL